MLRPLWDNTYRNLGARERRHPWVALTSGNLVKRPELADSRLSHCNMIVQYSERPDPTHCGHWSTKITVGIVPKRTFAEPDHQLGNCVENSIFEIG